LETCWARLDARSAGIRRPAIRDDGNAKTNGDRKTDCRRSGARRTGGGNLWGLPAGYRGWIRRPRKITSISCPSAWASIRRSRSASRSLSVYSRYEMFFLPPSLDSGRGGGSGDLLSRAARFGREPGRRTADPTAVRPGCLVRAVPAPAISV
jgi:hypothetical protein